MTEIVLCTKLRSGQVRKEVVPISEAQKAIIDALKLNQLTKDEIARAVALYDHNLKSHE